MVKDFICWLMPTPDSSRVVIAAKNRKEALEKYAAHLGCRVSGYMCARPRKAIERNLYEVRITA